MSCLTVRLVAFTAVIFLGGCAMHMPKMQWFGKRGIEKPGPSISDTIRHLPSARNIEAEVHEPDPEEVLALYQSVLDKVADGEMNYFVARRIAELEMALAESAAIEGLKEPFNEAIAGLERLLEDEHLGADLAYIRYQLAHAHDMNGNSEALMLNLNETIAHGGGTDFALEARFRRAELHFSSARHRSAAEDFDAVAKVEGKYRLHAQYMLGWSRFKQGNLDQALLAFVSAMDHMLGGQPGSGKAGQELLEDVKRISVITLDYLDGAETLASAMDTAGKPAWQTHLYQALGDWYREKQRFQDSAHTWDTFIDRNPMHAASPQIHLETIETYRSAGFVDEIGARKLEFIERYDKSGEFYLKHGDQVFSSYADTMLVFVDEVTAKTHAQAQQSRQQDDYLVASTWYERWLLNFAGHEQSGEKQFLLAETLSDAGMTKRSIDAYRLTISLYPVFERSKEASYAIVVALPELALETGESLIEEQIDANLQFAANFPTDERAKSTHVNAAKMLFDLNRFESAAEAAEFAITKWQLNELWRTTALISAHSRFELGEYAVSEVTYRQLLAAKPGDAALRDRLLAAVFKQAEAAELIDDTPGAITHYQRLSEVDPTSKVAIDASYDIAALYEKTGELDKAASQLQSFRQRHGRHPAVVDIPVRLVLIYEKLGFLEPAASELLSIYRNKNGLSEVRRQALYRAGELFLTANNLTMAIGAFRDYAHAYAQPFTVRMEAMQHMDDLYRQLNEPRKRKFWMRKKMKAFDTADVTQQDERTRYLAADAAFFLAEDQFTAFESIRLKLPLKRSLKKKRKAMTAAVKAYEHVTDYGVGEFMTGSTYRIALIYQSLGQSLIESDRPGKLSELELEQYEILLEEQAFPFEEQAIEIHQANLSRAWVESWDSWVGKSLDELKKLSPGFFRRDESVADYVSILY